MPACVHAWVNLHSHMTQEAESLALSMQQVTSCDWCCVRYASELLMQCTGAVVHMSHLQDDRSWLMYCSPPPAHAACAQQRCPAQPYACLLLEYVVRQPRSEESSADLGRRHLTGYGKIL